MTNLPSPTTSAPLLAGGQITSRVKGANEPGLSDTSINQPPELERCLHNQRANFAIRMDKFHHWCVHELLPGSSGSAIRLSEAD
jgi:hypothetical protein